MPQITVIVGISDKLPLENSELSFVTYENFWTSGLQLLPQ